MPVYCLRKSRPGATEFASLAYYLQLGTIYTNTGLPTIYNSVPLGAILLYALPVLEENVEYVHYLACSSIFISINQICDMEDVGN